MLVLNPLSARKAPGAYTATSRMETVDYENAFDNNNDNSNSNPPPHPETSPPPPPLVVTITRQEQEQNDRLVAVQLSAMSGGGEPQPQPQQQPQPEDLQVVEDGGTMVRTLEEDYDHPTIITDWSRKRKPLIMAVVVIMITIAIIAIAIPMVLQSNKNTSTTDASQQPQQQQQQQFDEEPLVSTEEVSLLVPNMTNTTIAALEDLFSQQSRAYDWISKEGDDWDTYEDWRKQQRFAMMCFYYGLHDGFSTWAFSPRHNTHECTWLNRFDACGDHSDNDDNNDTIGETMIVTKIGINFGHGTLAGTFPPELAFLSRLEGMEFLGNYFHLRPLGDVFPPETIRNLPPTLASIKVDRCEMGGSIPSALGLMTTLTSLDLPNTDLRSAIPSQLGLLTNLETLTLSSNSLTGTIPKQIGELSLLKNLDLRNNPDLTPPIPSGLCNSGRDDGRRVVPLESLITDWCFSPTECCT